MGHAEDAEVLAADEEVLLNIALVSVAVDHVIGPDYLPRTASISSPTGARARRHFVAANGDKIGNRGTLAVTGMSRPLQSASQICGNDYEVLVTKTEAPVRREGAWWPPNLARVACTFAEAK